MPSSEPPRPRRLVVALSAPQQGALMPQFTQVACQQLGISEAAASGIVLEALARLTPDMTMSELTLLKVLDEEIEAYRASPRAYEARGAYTTYEVLALAPDAPPDLGALSPDTLALHQPAQVPRNATPQSEWWEFSHEVDGYDIAERLGWDLGDLALNALMHHRQTGQWRGSLMDLRLTLFWKARALRHSGVATEDCDEDQVREVANLLEAIADRTPTPN